MSEEYEVFDPKKHKLGVKLYEVVTVGKVGTGFVLSKVDYDIATKTPWYYVVMIGK